MAHRLQPVRRLVVAVRVLDRRRPSRARRRPRPSPRAARRSPRRARATAIARMSRRLAVADGDAVLQRRGDRLRPPSVRRSLRRPCPSPRARAARESADSARVTGGRARARLRSTSSQRPKRTSVAYGKRIRPSTNGAIASTIGGGISATIVRASRSRRSSGPPSSIPTRGTGGCATCTAVEALLGRPRRGRRGRPRSRARSRRPRRPTAGRA
jgi:hypothetical protein